MRDRGSERDTDEKNIHMQRKRTISDAVKIEINGPIDMTRHVNCTRAKIYIYIYILHGKDSSEHGQTINRICVIHYQRGGGGGNGRHDLAELHDGARIGAEQSGQRHRRTL